jgi:hypothetical protein
MNRFRFIPIVFALALLPNLVGAAPGSGSDPKPGCKPSLLSQPVLNQSVAVPDVFAQPAPQRVSTFCQQYYCPGTAPVVQCNCACDAEECLCAEACAPGDFRCPQRCRNALNNCYVGCSGL